MSIDVVITETCRAMGRNQQWCVFKEKVLHADTIQEAKQEMRAYLDNGIYNVKRRKAVYHDRVNQPTIQSGYIYSGIEDTNYLQAWCSFYDHETKRAVDVTGGK